MMGIQASLTRSMKRKRVKSIRRTTIKFRNLLVPLDFSDLSLRALHHAVDITHSEGVLTLVYVVPVDYGLFGIGREESRALDKALQEQAADSLRVFAVRSVLPGVRVNLEVRVGRPGEEIVAAASERNSDLIVISTHGRTGLDRYLIGSVADRVARMTPCPVLLVPPHRRPSARQRSRAPVLRFEHKARRNI